MKSRARRKLTKLTVNPLSWNLYPKIDKKLNPAEVFFNFKFKVLGQGLSEKVFMLRISMNPEANSLLDDPPCCDNKNCFSSCFLSHLQSHTIRLIHHIPTHISHHLRKIPQLILPLPLKSASESSSAWQPKGRELTHVAMRTKSTSFVCYIYVFALCCYKGIKIMIKWVVSWPSLRSHNISYFTASTSNSPNGQCMSETT